MHHLNHPHPTRGASTPLVTAFLVLIVCGSNASAAVTHLPGFPVNMPPADVRLRPPTLVNLDADPELEIVFGDDQGQVRVFDGNGAEKPGFPVFVGGMALFGSTPAGNIDASPTLEIVAGNGAGQVVAVDVNGNVLTGFPVSYHSGRPVYVSLGDLVGDAKLEIVACTGNQIHVLTGTGAEVAGFPVFMTPGHDILGPAAIGDVDHDGNRDIVVESGEDIRWFRNSGVLGGIKVLLGESLEGSPALADIDGNDGDLEIAFGTAAGHVYALDHDMNVLPGWPFTAVGEIIGTVFGRLQPAQMLSLAFIGGKLQPGSRVYEVSHDGVLYPGWPFLLAGSLLSGAPVVAEMGNGPLAREVIYATPDDFVHVMTSAGVDMAGFPFQITEAIHSLAVGRVDTDAIADIVVTSYLRLDALEVDGASAGPVVGGWPMYGYDAAHSFCYQCGWPALVAAPLPALPAEPRLGPPEPNPAFDRVDVAFDLPAPSVVALDLFDSMGRRVTAIRHGWLPAGRQHETFRLEDERGRPVPAGIYVLSLAIDGGPRLSRRIAHM